MRQISIKPNARVFVAQSNPRNHFVGVPGEDASDVDFLSPGSPFGSLTKRGFLFSESLIFPDISDQCSGATVCGVTDGVLERKDWVYIGSARLRAYTVFEPRLFVF